MRTRAQTARLGIFVTIALGLLLATILVLSGRAFLEARDHYTILFSETVSGLEIGAPVKLLGVRVGRIESFRVVSEGTDKVQVTVSLDHGTPIRSNAHAVLSPSGLTGLVFVEITGGTADAPLIKPGGQIPAGSSVIGSLTGRAENIAVKTEEVLNRILSLTEEKNLDNLRQSLDNIQVATLKLRNVLEGVESAVPSIVKASNQLDPLFHQLGDSAAAVRAAANQLGAVAGDTRKVAGNLDALTRPDGAVYAAVDQLHRTLQTVDAVLGGQHAEQTSQELRAALRSFTETMNQLSTVLGSSGADVQRVTSSLRSAAEHLDEFSRAISENPSLLVRPSGGR